MAKHHRPEHLGEERSLVQDGYPVTGTGALKIFSGYDAALTETRVLPGDSPAHDAYLPKAEAAARRDNARLADEGWQPSGFVNAHPHFETAASVEGDGVGIIGAYLGQIAVNEPPYPHKHAA